MFCMTADKARPCKTFAVTVQEAPPGGKSLTAANIAISYAMLGKRVLLVDADMRKPTQRRLLEGRAFHGPVRLSRQDHGSSEAGKGHRLPLWINAPAIRQIRPGCCPPTA